jgi:DNA-binding response OmpR family regulator
MPDMSGMELHAWVSRIAPDQAARMVFLTGGIFTSHARAFLAAVPNTHIEKPFDTHRLRLVVNGCLRQHEAVST